MAANRGEIAVRILRAGNELGLRTTSIYSYEDRNTAHRYKADQGFQVGTGLAPVQAYLCIEDIIRIAKENNVDAIHPGYGFLSERTDFAQACKDNGITFVGPTVKNLADFGDKTTAREMAIAAKVPVVPGTDGPISTYAEAKSFCCDEFGFPIIIKAAMGGGGRGMRVVWSASELEENFTRASSEALSAFGDGTVFIERYVDKPRHLEIQILGDGKGNVVHLYERDCSIQRRHQKVVELAPSMGLPQETLNNLYNDAKHLTASANYLNAGTVEFLVDQEGRHYFIEVNPRVQVEHTVTEEVTGIDIVQSQIKLASGMSFEEIGLKQDDIRPHGHAIQCRVTTEDPTNGFTPDYGKLTVYRPPGGMGVRLDDGPGFAGAVITPHYDSLLTKLTVTANTRELAATKTLRALTEFRVRGVKTNIPFLQNVMSNEEFLTGSVTTSFIDENPGLLEPKKIRRNRGNKILEYLGNIIVNGNATELGATGPPPSRIDPIVPVIEETPKSGERSLKQIFDQEGAPAFAKAVREKKGLLLTDTTWRDAHQSLLATRVRTNDILKIAKPTAQVLSNAYSLENWGGATYDVSYRFLREDPWERLGKLREAVPDIPFQMLLRGANAVGYTAYPDNVVHRFCDLAVKHGMDVFRVFDSLNYVENMRLGIDAVGGAGGIVEGAICYTGDISDPEKGKYTLEYYLDFARQLVNLGVHVLCIKDMAGLLKPKAATMLVAALRKEHPNVPIHVHTHDTAGIGAASMLAAAEAGADVVDVAIDAMSGTSSQPSMGAIVGAVRNSPLDTGLDPEKINQINEYWEMCREVYGPFESGQKSGSADVYSHEMPGGQYTNLLFQSTQLGLAGQWPAIKKAYAAANRLLGDIVKVTPSSKVVGDLAQFMVQNNLSEEDVIEQAETLSFPTSVVEYFQGYLGIPHGGFPEPLCSKILKGKTLPNGKQQFTGRPGAEMDPYDFDAAKAELQAQWPQFEISDFDVISHALYPKVFNGYLEFKEKHGDISIVPTRQFLVGMEIDEEITIEISHGKTLYICLRGVSDVDDNGNRTLNFELNGGPRIITIPDEEFSGEKVVREVADTSISGHVAAPMPGVVIEVKCKVGDHVEVGEALVVLSAMKMETVVSAPVTGVVKRVIATPNANLQAGDL
eukprot:CAMPEP_0184028624 /NCGR_PEP_ID=MMETSP0954-20121128/14951_1 /TAXON_ID=627963 /ORGANISM="Aplanochytrium sp, Strain PBS07" /LENGTH=1143 /DNA_ID=CAMNT_0026313503 /DNA_START=209 /DNA_END=3637 /DNA_ORIENTATION=-